MKSDADLMSAFCAGDETAFERLVKRNQVGLLNFFYRLVWDQALAEDLTQEAFLRLYSHKESYDRQTGFTVCLYRLGCTCWVDYLRRTTSEQKPPSLPLAPAAGEENAKALPERSDEAQGGMRKDDLAESVMEALVGLPEEERITLLLSEVQGMKYREIGATLQIAEGEVKIRMSKALKHLREALARPKDATGPWKADGERA